MKLEIGKYYRTRDGRKVGPMRYHKSHDCFYWDSSVWSALAFNNDGKRRYKGYVDDIIAEWTDTHGPVRTVTTTRQEIVPGVYGRVVVERESNGDIVIDARNMITDDEITAAIQTLTAIRDAMQP